MRGKYMFKIFCLILMMIDCFVFRNGLIVSYLMGVLIPFLCLLAVDVMDVRHDYIEYLEDYIDESGKDDVRIIVIMDEIFGYYVTKSFLKKATSFVEKMEIKMVMRGCHSIHAEPIMNES